MNALHQNEPQSSGPGKRGFRHNRNATNSLYRQRDLLRTKGSGQATPSFCTQFLYDQHGAELLELALVLPVLVLLLVGAMDYGRAYYAAIEVASAAEQGALYGTVSPTDTTGMIAMAKLDATDVSGLTVTAQYGCECSDGSASSVNCVAVLTCSSNAVKYVQVTTNATYNPVLPYPGIPSTIPLTRTVRMRAGN